MTSIFYPELDMYAQDHCIPDKYNMNIWWIKESIIHMHKFQGHSDRMNNLIRFSRFIATLKLNLEV